MSPTAGGAPIVRVEPSGIELAVEPGETVIEAAWRLGYRWPTVCFGEATCTVCHMEVLDGDDQLSPVEADEADALEYNLPSAWAGDRERTRLACRARVTGPVTVLKKGVRPQSGAPT